MSKKLLFGLVFSVIISAVILGTVVYCILLSYTHGYMKSTAIAVNPHQIMREYIIDEISHQTNIRTKEESTTATYGSPDESVLVSADMSGYHTIKKIIIVEEK